MGMRLRREAGGMPVVFIVSTGPESPDIAAVEVPRQGHRVAKLPPPATMSPNVLGVAYEVPGGDPTDELGAFLANRHEGTLVVEWGPLDGVPLSDTVFALSDTTPRGSDKTHADATCDRELLETLGFMLRAELLRLAGPNVVRINYPGHAPSTVISQYRTWRDAPHPAESVQALRLLFNRELYELLRPAGDIDKLWGAQLLLGAIVERALTAAIIEYTRRVSA